jgi:hypothetical protein
MDRSGGLARRVVSSLVIGTIVVILVAGVLVLVSGLPSRTFTLAAGAQGGAYYAFAERLRDVLHDRGFTLVVLETNGSVDNVKAVQDGRADIALVQSGTEQVADVSGLTALSELFYEPIWIWYRSDALAGMDSLTDLDGRRVAMGVPGSGTFAIAETLFDANGMTGVQRVEANAADAERMLQAGEVDAAIVVASANAPIVARLAADPGLGVYEYRHAEAYARRFPFLSSIGIARGVLDIPRDVPPADGTMLAARATLVGKPGLHPDLARLLVTVLPNALPYPLVGDPKEFPSLAATQFPVNDDAARFLAEGPTPLEGVLPFEIASPLSRYYVLMLPLLVLLYPAWQILKAGYGWYMSSKITNWYPRIYAIERGLPDATLPELELQHEFLRAIVARVASRTRVSAGYLAGYYDLRNNIGFVQQQVQARIDELRAAEGLTVPARAGDREEPGLDPAQVDDLLRISDEAMGIDDDLRAMRKG